MTAKLQPVPHGATHIDARGHFYIVDPSSPVWDVWEDGKWRVTEGIAPTALATMFELRPALQPIAIGAVTPLPDPDTWYCTWFNRYPDDVRKKLSLHDLRRMYTAITGTDPATS